MMARTWQDVTEAELAVLRALWEQGPCSRRQLTDLLYTENPQAQYTTVQKLLERLEAKGFVAQSKSSGTLTFRALIERDQLISQRLLALAEKLCDGSVTPLFTNLVRAKPLTKAELQSLHELLENLKRSNRPRGKRP
jgi:predicted transcriptional regulator